VLTPRIFQQLVLSVLFLLASLFASINSYAALIDVQQKNDIVYFLFAAPNKIVRYDLASNEFLVHLPLNNIPTAFHVNESYIYTAYGTELKRSDITGLNGSSIYQFPSDILQVTSLNDTLFISDDNSNATLINALDNSLIDKDYIYNITMATASNSQGAIYHRTNRKYSNSLSKFTPGSIPKRISSDYPSDLDETRKIYINNTEDKIFADSGFIFSAENLDFMGSLGGAFNHITFINDQSLVLRGNKLSLYDANNHDIGHLVLNNTPTHVAGKNDIITTFSTTDSLVSAQHTDIKNLSNPTLEEPTNPRGLAYNAEKVVSDNENILYLLDANSRVIHRRKVTEKIYVKSWGLFETPSWMTFSISNKRLYLGYDSGRITYFDTSQGDDATETHFITLGTAIKGLLAAGDFVYTLDHQASGYIHYGINSSGKIINTIQRSTFGTKYLWSQDQNTIHYRFQNLFREIYISPTDGSIKLGTRTSYNSEIRYSPIFHLSPDGQVLLNGSGQVIGAKSLKVLNNTSNFIDDAVWINNYLVTTLKETNTLQIWQEDYQLVSQQTINNAKHIRLFPMNGNLLILTQSDIGPVFTIYDLLNMPDSDNDTISDLNDNCINTTNTTQDDFDNDYIGDACDLDNDNDLIPNTIEKNAGLNPIDSTDSNLDLDNDGFTNLVEYFNSTDINDVNSKPELVTQYLTNFNSGIPKDFYQLESRNLWSKRIIEDDAVLVSGRVKDNSQSSSIYYTAEFINGIISFDYKLIGDRYYRHKVDFYLDGEALKNVGESYNWRESKLEITAGVHSIEIKLQYNDEGQDPGHTHLLIDNFSFSPDSDGDSHGDNEDNCPNIHNESQYDYDSDGKGNDCDNTPYGRDRDNDDYSDDKDNCPYDHNPDQADLDNDNIGDACDSSDDRPSDKDQDSIPDDRDNCPETANSRQENFDNDELGDICDLDIDNDGILNTVEDQYQFLNSFNQNDGLLDFDNDGASNQYEVNHDSRPDAKDTFTVVNLLEYYPLGNIEYFYITNNQFIRATVSEANKRGQFVVDFNNDTEWLIERRESGIYILEFTDNSNESKLLFNDFPIFPSKLLPGQAITYTASSFREGSSIVNDIWTQMHLKDVGETAWRGKVYPSITITENGHDTTYLKGIGPINRFGLELDSVNLDTLAPPDLFVSKNTSKNAGHLNTAFLFAILLLTLYSRSKSAR